MKKLIIIFSIIFLFLGCGARDDSGQDMGSFSSRNIRCFDGYEYHIISSGYNGYMAPRIKNGEFVKCNKGEN